MVYTLINYGAEADIITPFLLKYSRLNYNRQRLEKYKTFNYQPLTIYKTASVLYKVMDLFELKQNKIDSFFIGEVAGFDMVLGML